MLDHAIGIVGQQARDGTGQRRRYAAERHDVNAGLGAVDRVLPGIARQHPRGEAPALIGVEPEVEFQRVLRIEIDRRDIPADAAQADREIGHKRRLAGAALERGDYDQRHQRPPTRSKRQSGTVSSVAHCCCRGSTVTAFVGRVRPRCPRGGRHRLRRQRRELPLCRDLERRRGGCGFGRRRREDRGLKGLRLAGLFRAPKQLLQRAELVRRRFRLRFRRECRLGVEQRRRRDGRHGLYRLLDRHHHVMRGPCRRGPRGGEHGQKRPILDRVGGIRRDRRVSRRRRRDRQALEQSVDLAAAMAHADALSLQTGTQYW